MITKQERMRINSAKYHAKHRDEINKREREKRKNNPEYRIKAIARQKLWRENNKEKFALIKKNSVLKSTYGITIDEYNVMFKLQKGSCAICKNSQVKNINYLCVDHSHKTNKIRGLLCHTCNRSLGLLKDDIKVLENAINYLKKYV